MEETISVELAKWLLVGAGAAIVGQAGFIVKLILYQRKEISDARAEWSNTCDKEVERLIEQLNQAQQEKLAAIHEKDRLQNEFIQTLQALRANNNRNSQRG